MLLYTDQVIQALSDYTGFSEKELQETCHILINAFDQEHRILFWNASCEQYFGITREQAIGQKLEVLIPGVKGDERLRNLSRALSGQRIHILIEKYQRKEGHYEQNLIPVKNEDGKVVAVLNLVQDLAHRPSMIKSFKAASR